MKGTNLQEYSFPLEIQVLGIVAYKLCNLEAKKAKRQEQETELEEDKNVEAGEKAKGNEQSE